MRLHALAGFGLVLAVAGCAQNGTPNGWSKPGASAAQLQADQNDCTVQAVGQYPVKIQEAVTKQGYYQSGYRDCSGQTAAGNNDQTATCGYVPGHYVPPSSSRTDVNMTARNQVVNACLQQRGWHFQ